MSKEWENKGKKSKKPLAIGVIAVILLLSFGAYVYASIIPIETEQTETMVVWQSINGLYYKAGNVTVNESGNVTFELIVRDYTEFDGYLLIKFTNELWFYVNGYRTIFMNPPLTDTLITIEDGEFIIF